MSARLYQRGWAMQVGWEVLMPEVLGSFLLKSTSHLITRLKTMCEATGVSPVIRRSYVLWNDASCESSKVWVNCLPFRLLRHARRGSSIVSRGETYSPDRKSRGSLSLRHPSGSFPSTYKIPSKWPYLQQEISYPFLTYPISSGDHVQIPISSSPAAVGPHWVDLRCLHQPSRHFYPTH